MINRIRVVGFADENGQGPELDQKFTEDDFYASKSSHVFPAGVKHLKLIEQQEIECSILIGESIGAAIEKARKERDEKDSAIAASKTKVGKAQAAVASAQKKVRDAARARNDLMGRLHSAESKLENHNITPEQLRGKKHNLIVDEIKSLINGDPSKNIAGLKVQVADAVAAYDEAVKELGKLTAKNTEIISPEPKSQLVEA